MAKITEEMVLMVLAAADDGKTAADIAFELNLLDEGDIDGLYSEYFDDSDAATERRHCISQDDRFDSRGRALKPALNEAGEPWWM